LLRLRAALVFSLMRRASDWAQRLTREMNWDIWGWAMTWSNEKAQITAGCRTPTEQRHTRLKFNAALQIMKVFHAKIDQAWSNPVAIKFKVRSWGKKAIQIIVTCSKTWKQKSMLSFHWNILMRKFL
jgi:hypothetical protein